MPTQLEAVIFDWAGTVVDFGSFAPTQIFVDAFKSAFDFELSLAEARGPMGLGKWQHIEALGNDPAVGARWQAQFGRAMGECDVRHIYETFIPLQVERVGQHSTLIPGALQVVQGLRERSLKIGSTTGYTREIMAKVLPRAAAAGYQPDNLVCAGDLLEGRPGPLMMYRTMADLGAYPPWSIVKVDDTTPGIEEGLAAGTWTVGIAASGNEVGLALEEWLALSDADRRARANRAGEVLRRAGAHYLIDTVAELLPVIEAIEHRMAAGERPPQP